MGDLSRGGFRHADANAGDRMQTAQKAAEKPLRALTEGAAGGILKSTEKSDIEGTFMPIIDISRELTAASPYAGDPAPRMHTLATHDKDGYQLQAIVMSLHAATHVDAPLHFLEGGGDIPSLPLDAFFGPCTVLTVPSGPLDAAFFMRGVLGSGSPYARERDPYHDRVLLRGPGYLLKSAVGYLYTRGVKLVGTDRQSIGLPTDEKTAHTALLTYGIAVLENLDLSAAPDGQYLLSAAPLKIAGAEGAPCRAFLSR